jgi:hypothetical protein
MVPEIQDMPASPKALAALLNELSSQMHNYCR